MRCTISLQYYLSIYLRKNAVHTVCVNITVNTATFIVYTVCIHITLSVIVTGTKLLYIYNPL